MHVAGLPLDLNWLLQLIFAAFFVALGLLHVAKNAASKFFLVDANFEGGGSEPIVNGDMPAVSRDPCVCAVCGNSGNKKCSGCKAIRYCSHACQSQHWRSGHRTTCRNNQLYGKTIPMQSKKVGLNFSCYGGSRGLALIPDDGGTKAFKLSNKVLFPYDDFRKLFSWEIHGFPPCGLINCGNSCFVNVVLQCLMYTRPLTAYLLEKGHRGECRRNDWCFMCELQTHVERASKNACPFSPKNILSRLPCIGGNLGYGKQEDAHEFMRFAIDTLQSTCFDEFGGEKALHPKSQETTLIQHIFGGHLQSQIICTKCNKISNQYENMMDLTVEIHGEVASLEECLEQFTVKEWLHGENMYKCDECTDYVKAWKRLTIKLSPNILTIALKRFQSGRFTKLNKRITFPETLDLSPYMSDGGDGTDTYKLYAVVVHVDMLNASFFGHYICYIKDFSGSWFRVDDCKVERVELEVALSQRAYMLLYRRISARKSGLFSTESSRTEEKQAVGLIEKSDPCQNQRPESIANTESIDPTDVSGPFPSVNSEDVSSLLTNPEARRNSESAGMADRISCSPVPKNTNGSLSSEAVSCSTEDKCEPEDSSASGHNGFFKEDEHETIVETNPLYNRKKTEEIKSGEELQNSGHVPNGGNSRGPKPKPLFPPGFLLNQPNEKGSRPGGFSGKTNNYCNGLAKIQQKDMNG